MPSENDSGELDGKDWLKSLVWGNWTQIAKKHSSFQVRTFCILAELLNVMSTKMDPQKRTQDDL